MFSRLSPKRATSRIGILGIGFKAVLGVRLARVLQPVPLVQSEPLISEDGQGLRSPANRSDERCLIFNVRDNIKRLRDLGVFGTVVGLGVSATRTPRVA